MFAVEVEAATDPYETASFSITAGALLHVAVTFRDAVSQLTTTITDSFGGLGAWTKVNESEQGGIYSVIVWRAQDDGTGGSGTLTFDTNTSPSHMIIHVVEMTGAHATAPEIQDVVGGGIANTLTLTLATAPLAGSATIGSAGGTLDSATAITGGTGETTILESATAGVTNRNRMLTQFSTDIEHNWGNMPTEGNNGVLWEVAQAVAEAGGAPVVQRFRRV